MTKLSPDELAQRLKVIYDALGGNGQAAGGLFGLLYAAHLAWIIHDGLKTVNGSA